MLRLNQLGSSVEAHQDTPALDAEVFMSRVPVLDDALRIVEQALPNEASDESKIVDDALFDALYKVTTKPQVETVAVPAVQPVEQTQSDTLDLSDVRRQVEASLDDAEGSPDVNQHL